MVSEINALDASLNILSSSKTAGVDALKTAPNTTEQASKQDLPSFTSRSFTRNQTIPAYTVTINPTDRSVSTVKTNLGTQLDKVFGVLYSTDSEAAASAKTESLNSFSALLQETEKDISIDSLQIRLGTLTTNTSAQDNTNISSYTTLVVQGNTVRGEAITTQQTLILDIEGKKVDLPEADIAAGLNSSQFQTTITSGQPQASTQLITDMLGKNITSIQSALDSVLYKSKDNLDPFKDVLNQITQKTLITYDF